MSRKTTWPGVTPLERKKPTRNYALQGQDNVQGTFRSGVEVFVLPFQGESFWLTRLFLGRCPRLCCVSPTDCRTRDGSYAPQGQNNIARGNAPGTEEANPQLRPAGAGQCSRDVSVRRGGVCFALSGRIILLGAFVPGALPQAMLCQSCGLKDVTTSGDVVCSVRIGALPQAMLCQSCGLKDVTTSGDVVCSVRIGALPQAMLCQSCGLKDVTTSGDVVCSVRIGALPQAMLCQSCGLKDVTTSGDVVCSLRIGMLPQAVLCQSCGLPG